jgi:hypothetical protein
VVGRAASDRERYRYHSDKPKRHFHRLFPPVSRSIFNDRVNRPRTADPFNEPFVKPAPLCSYKSWRQAGDYRIRGLLGSCAIFAFRCNHPTRRRHTCVPRECQSSRTLPRQLSKPATTPPRRLICEGLTAYRPPCLVGAFYPRHAASI